MKIQIDTENKTISLEEGVNLGKLFNHLDYFFPDNAWEEYDLIPVEKIQNWKNSMNVPYWGGNNNDLVYGEPHQPFTINTPYCDGKLNISGNLATSSTLTTTDGTNETITLNNATGTALFTNTNNVSFTIGNDTSAFTSNIRNLEFIEKDE